MVDMVPILFVVVTNILSCKYERYIHIYLKIEDHPMQYINSLGVTDLPSYKKFLSRQLFSYIEDIEAALE